MELNKTELKPIIDTAQSFYKKAYYTEEDIKDTNYVVYTLYSYNIKVMEIYRDIANGTKSYYKLTQDTTDDDIYTKTTMRHIKEMLHQWLIGANVYETLDFLGFTKKTILAHENYTSSILRG